MLFRSDNPEFNGKIFTSKRIGISYINKNTLNRHRYQGEFTEETYRTNSGIKTLGGDRIRSEKKDRRSNRRPARTPILDRNSEYNPQTGASSREYGNRRKNRKSDQRIHGKKDERNTPQEFIDSNTTLRSRDEI